MSDLPFVAGRTCQRSLVDLDRAAHVLLQEYNTPDANQALIGVLCDTVRLCREYSDFQGLPAYDRGEVERLARMFHLQERNAVGLPPEWESLTRKDKDRLIDEARTVFANLARRP